MMKDIKQYLENHFSTNYTSTPVKYENSPFNDYDQQHVVFTLDFSETSPYAIGVNLNDRYKYEAELIINIITPASKGTNRAYELAEQIRNLYQFQSFNVNPNLILDFWKPAEYKAYHDQNGNHVLTIVLPFTAYHT